MVVFLHAIDAQNQEGHGEQEAENDANCLEEGGRSVSIGKKPGGDEASLTFNSENLVSRTTVATSTPSLRYDPCQYK